MAREEANGRIFPLKFLDFLDPKFVIQMENKVVGTTRGRAWRYDQSKKSNLYGDLFAKMYGKAANPPKKRR